MRTERLMFFLCLICLYGCERQNGDALKGSVQTVAAGEPDRSSLPIREPARQTYKELDARNAKPPARFEVKAP